MQLHGPAATGVHPADFKQDGGAEDVDFFWRRNRPGKQLVEQGVEFLLAGEVRQRCAQAVVGGAAAQFVEGGMALVQCFDQGFVGADRDIGDGPELAQILFPGHGIFDRQCLVRAVAGHHHRLAGLAFFRVGDVMFERVARIVGGADGTNFHAHQQLACAECRGVDYGVAGFPDFWRGFFGKRLVNIEITLQFEVRPVVQRVADQVGNGLGPGQEGLVIRFMAGDVLFRNTV